MILLLGGTGVMGTELRKLMNQKGVEYLYTTRNSNLSDEKVLVGNAKEMSFLKSTLDKSLDVIIDFMVYTSREFQERYELILNSTKHYIFLSSSRVYRNTGGERISIKTPRILDTSMDKVYLDTDEYALTKARQEDILVNSKYNNYSILRPYITFNKERIQLMHLEKEKWLNRWIEGKKIVLPEEVLNKFTTMTPGYQVSKMILKIASFEPKAKVYNLVQDQAFRWSKIIELYQQVFKELFDITPSYETISVKDYVQNFGHKYQIIYDRMYDRKFNSDNLYVNEKTSDVLNELRQELNLFLRQPVFKYIDIKHEALSDRITGEKAYILKIRGLKDKLRYIKHRYFRGGYNG